MTSQRRIVIAPDSFKGTATAPEVVDALAAGLGDGVEIIRMPMADGERAPSTRSRRPCRGLAALR